MAHSAAEYKEIYEAVHGKADYRPRIRFYDHATLDVEASAKAGRNKYREVAYVQIKPTHPDLDVRDTKSRPASAIHPDSRLPYSEAFPKEWAIYQKKKERDRDLKPVLQAIPGMTIGPGKELMDLGIFDCHDLLEYEGDLGDLERFRDLARRIVALVDEVKSEPNTDTSPAPVETTYTSPEKGVVIPLGPSLREQVTPQTFHYEWEL